MNRPHLPRTPMRSIVSGLCALLGSLAVGFLPAACQSGGVGDPCTPEDEFNIEFHGFDVTEDNIESRSFQCHTRICLVNHFQGRASCPLGQGAPTPCDSKGDTSCGEGQSCVEAMSIETPCDPDGEDQGASQCLSSGKTCDKATRSCVCGSSEDCPAGARCDPESKKCKRYVCHAPGACQAETASEAENKGKDCCVPTTDIPITAQVCGQCSQSSKRSAEQAVYCSCRCGPPDGQAPDPDSDYCDCPSGYECSEIRKNYKLGDPQLVGKYCIKQGTAYKGPQECGQVSGHYNKEECSGISTGG